MKLTDGLNLPTNLHGKVTIPDCSRNDLPQLFVDMGYKVGAEIGAYRGEFTEKFCKLGLKMYAIDPWKPYRDYRRMRPGFEKRSEELYEMTKKRLKPHDCEIIRKMSMEAVKDFEDGSLDFVYIDGNHGFKYVAEDIYEWSFKVREGGAISGHDYAYARNAGIPLNILHVGHVVDAYTKAFEIKPWYVLGRVKRRDGEVRDGFRSWMWFKK